MTSIRPWLVVPLLVACRSGGDDGGSPTDGDTDGPGPTAPTDDTGPTGPTSGTAEVLVNEVLASNTTGLQDEGGAYPDWIELYNAGAVDVDLEGFSLSEEDGWFDQWVFPAGVVIPAGGYVVVLADEDVDEGPLHASFRLSSDGEELNLYGRERDGHPWLDRADFGLQTPDVSWSRVSDGDPTWQADATPTPGAANG